MYKDWADKLTNPYLIKDQDKNILYQILMQNRYDDYIPLNCKMECLDCYYDIAMNRWESIVKIERPDETYLMNIPAKLTKHWIWENTEHEDFYLEMLEDFNEQDAERYMEYLKDYR